MSEPKKTESFAGNVMKYSIATYLGFGISGAALIIKGVLPAESYAVPASFMAYTMSLMNVGMLGLDQSLLRFYHEPPAGSTGRSMFAACTRLSVLVMLLAGGIGSIFFAKPLAAAFGLGANGAGLVPFLFLNAALYMLVRYLNVLLRLENNVRAYTTETLWMQACLNLIYLLPGFVTQDARAFVLGAVCSFAGVAVFYWRRASKGQTKEAPVRDLRPYAHIYRAALPYGIVLAPAAILIPLYRAICLSFLGNYAPAAEQGSFDFAYTLAQLVTTIQAGFSTYWGPYVYAHYRTEQERIGRIHDLLNLLIFGFFCLLVMFEDIIFIIFPAKSACLPYFPLMMLAVVFSILCEGTVYGNTIARKPFHDWNRRGRCGQHCRVRRAGAAFWRNGCRGRPGSGQCNDVFVPHCDRAVLLPHHPQLQPDDLRLFAGGGCGRDRRGVRPQFYHQVCFNCSNPVYLL